MDRKTDRDIDRKIEKERACSRSGIVVASKVKRETLHSQDKTFSMATVSYHQLIFLLLLLKACLLSIDQANCYSVEARSGRSALTAPMKRAFIMPSHNGRWLSSQSSEGAPDIIDPCESDSCFAFLYFMSLCDPESSSTDVYSLLSL